MKVNKENVSNQRPNSFDGYWYPDIDINESLSDRLGELTYEPEELESQPIQEQSLDSPKKDGPQLDETPFTKLDVNIMNRLVTMFDRNTLAHIWEEDESQLPSEVYDKYENLMKLYGERSKSEWSFARSTRFCKMG